MFRELLDAGADANDKLPGGETALMTAARTGRVEPVQMLMAAGADVNAKERTSQTAMMWAAADGHADVVRILIEAKADFKTPLKSGFTPLFFAVREGRSDVVKVLLDAGSDVNTTMQPEKASGRSPGIGTSPLIMAVENGHFDLAVMLLKAGADPNDQRSGFTPLHTMTWVRKPNRGDGIDGEPPPQGSGQLTSLQFVETLVLHGADVNMKIKKGEGGKAKLARTGATPFLLAADTADVPLLRLLVKLGADPNVANVDGTTPLMAAAGFGTGAPGEEAGTEPELLEAVAFLLELGADINVVDRNGETAMHGAAYKNAPAVVKLLADRGAKASVWNHPNKHGWTPVDIAKGYRPGNFRPSPDTLAAINAALRP
jgi:ankyrin repeat protein